MADAKPPPADTVVIFTDHEREYRVAVPRQGHTDGEVRMVAYRWCCKQVAEGEWTPRGELRYLSMAPLL